jgi:cyclic pyranopterin phosphate synthase
LAELSHLDDNGRLKMVDVGAKPAVKRRAAARGEIVVGPRVAELIRKGAMEKGDVLAAARLAGIQAAKRTHELIPLCHPLPLEWIDVACSVLTDRVVVTTEVRLEGKTGVEMEALTAAAVALLAVYDMAKSAREPMTIGPIELIEKEKGDPRRR